MSVNTSGAYSSPNFAGTVGEAVFRRYHVFLDYARKRAIFEPTREASAAFPDKRTYGLSVLASGPSLNEFTVAAVRAGSPAERDSFRKGDVITALDGKASSGFTLSEVRDRFAREDERHVVSVARARGSVEIPIVVRLVSIESSP
jgi:S1-C subfamily serine protease